MTIHHYNQGQYLYIHMFVMSYMQLLFHSRTDVDGRKMYA